LSGCTIPTGLMTTSITASSATLSWTMVTGAANYEYVIDNIATNPTGVGTQTPNAFYNAGGLSPATLYYFHLRSDCGIGNYSQWTSTSFTTASLCNTPTGLTAANVGATSADLSWTAVSGAIGYQYVVDMSSMNPSGPGTGTTATTYSASGLNPSSTYYLHVRTQCSTTDFSAWSTIPFTTKTPNGLTDVNKDAFEWSLSPVPVQHILTLEIAGVNRRGSIQVCDVSGRKLKEVTYMGGILSMDLHDLESGYYWLRYANGSQMSTRAFLKQ
ncbi:MAG TPA: fibronectin type III domain-containing protein, partial [Chitinophagaceae bacterium]|nr:fibronectin type III domain-containing protein [Chitinophagaceae bacterium]